MAGGGLVGERWRMQNGVGGASWSFLDRCSPPAIGRAAVLSSPLVLPMTENPRKRSLRPLLSGVVLRSQTDGRLSALARAGNEQAFSVIYERYRRELGSHAGRIVRADRADDVVQQAMFSAWTALLAGAEITDLRAWLHRVVHNAAVDTVTRRGYDDSQIPESSIAPTLSEELAEGRLNAASALAAIAALPESQRRALTLTAIEGHSGHDAARAMNISESAVRQLVYRARSGVRAAVTAITPLPLINRLVESAGVSAAPAAVGLGVAGGGAATVAKVVAVIGVTAATLGGTHAFQGHHHAKHARRAPVSPAVTTAADGHRQVGASTVQQRVADTRLGGGRHQNGGQGGSSQRDSSGHAGQQSGSQDTARGSGGHQSEAQQQSAVTGRTVTARSGTSSESQPQSSRGTVGTFSGQSGSDLSPAPQNGQSGNGN
jgi:RNA polymerase sigma-70 factor (ECF subfamily)